MNRDFIQIKHVNGELKFSHKITNLGVTVSTQELIVQKPHLNVYIQLADIISIAPYRIPYSSKIQLRSKRGSGQEIVYIEHESHFSKYRIYVAKAIIHQRSGKREVGAIEIIIPLHQALLMAISACSDMKFFDLDEND